MSIFIRDDKVKINPLFSGKFKSFEGGEKMRVFYDFCLTPRIINTIFSYIFFLYFVLFFLGGHSIFNGGNG